MRRDQAARGRLRNLGCKNLHDSILRRPGIGSCCQAVLAPLASINTSCSLWQSIFILLLWPQHVQVVAELTTEIANMPDDESCPPAVIIPLYAALPPEQQVKQLHLSCDWVPH